MEYIPIIYYINLDYRVDRNGELLDWLEETKYPEEKIQRISAVYTPGRGHLGCVLSHIKTLEQFLKSDHNLCFVLEDDYRPLNISNFWNSIEQIFIDSVDFDIILLAHNQAKLSQGPTSYLSKVHESYTTSGFLFTREFATKLLKCWKESVPLLLQEEASTGKKTHQFMLDVYWTNLLASHKTYCFTQRIGKQQASFSDLQMQYTDYNA